MSLAGVLMLTIGALLALAASWLAIAFLRKEQAALSILADQQGWDRQPTSPSDFAPLAARVLPASETHPSPRFVDHFAGPSSAGPFRLARTRIPPTEGHGKAEATIVHIRTSRASPGLHLEPTRSFHPRGAQTSGDASDRFSRLYVCHGDDPEFTHHSLDEATRGFIAAPRRMIRLDWQDHDLVIAYPFAVRTPSAVQAIVTWSTALARHLNLDPQDKAHRTWSTPTAPEPTVHGDATQQTS